MTGPPDERAAPWYDDSQGNGAGSVDPPIR